jgi:membrane fusion protein (multidrug efflux system)
MTTAARTGLDTSAAGEVQAQAPARPASRRRFILMAVALVAATAGGTWYVTHRGLESTDDAQVDGEVVAVPARLGGIITRVNFVENQHVKAGDLLAELDDAQAKAKLAQAEAMLAAALATADASDAEVQIAEANAVGNKSVAEAGLQTAAVGVTSFADQIKEGEAQVHTAEASLAQASSDLERAKALFASQSIAKAEFDRTDTAHSVAESSLAGARARLGMLRESANQARTRVVEASAKVKQTSLVEPLAREAHARADAAHAQAETARAARDLAALDLSYTKILAPQDGVVSKKSVNVGQAISIGQAIVQLVTSQTWVTANFKETQVGAMRVGQTAEFSVDAFPGETFSGEVESLSGATGAKFTLLAPDNASGNFTKVVQRVPVRIKVHEATPGLVLRPGMSVDLTVDTRK